MRTRVLCTFGATYGGGILRVITDGLPHLNRQPGIDLTIGDLYEREEIKIGFRDAGLSVTELGIPSRPYTSIRTGLARQIDRVRALGPHWRIANRLRHAARAVDALYVHTYKELVLATGSRARIVWHCHGVDVVAPFTATLARQCDRIIAISETVAGILRGIGVPANRIITVLNAVDLRSVHAGTAPLMPLPARGQSPVALLPVSAIRKDKGIHLVLEAARHVPSLDIWITGDMKDPAVADYAGQLRELSGSGPLAGRVHFLGHRPDIYAVMRAADIVCVPSLVREGFGLVAAEAMALAKPVIVSDRGALPELVRHGETGIVINPERPFELVTALEKLMTDSEYAGTLGTRGASSIKLRCSYERWARDVAAVLSGCQ